ncbi:MAG TPA: glycosyltransferase, partial [Bacteroidia bacterium]
VNDAYRLHHLFGSYEGKDVVFYSYWFNLWMAALCMQKRLGLLHHQLLTRAHGGDYDEAQKKEGYFPFREFELKQIERLLPVSYYGKTYLERKYPFYRGQLSVAYLGVTDKGDNPFKDDAPFHLVSCSFLIPLKRVHLIIEILEHIGLPVKWTHIGEGELMSEVRARAAKLPSSVSVEFPGHLSNDKVMEFYGKTPIDLFVNVSELEGVPVSIMEAISFGIPVTGCRICGVPEIVTDATGFLFEKDFDPIREAHRLKEYLLLPATAKEEFRKGVKAFWRARFNANVNYPAFIEGQLFPLK